MNVRNTLAILIIPLSIIGCTNTPLQDNETRSPARLLDDCTHLTAPLREELRQTREEQRRTDETRQRLQSQLAERQRQLIEEQRKSAELQDKVNALRAIDRDTNMKPRHR